MGGSMNRRMFSGGAMLSALPLGACAGRSAKVRYRVIATFELDGERVEASTVMEVQYWRVVGSSTRGGDGGSYGEALIFDIKGRGTVFLLPMENQQGSPGYLYESVIPVTLGIRRGVGSYENEDFDVLNNASGRMPLYTNGNIRLPVFVAFKDEQIPNTVYEVKPKDMAATFGPGVRFIGLEIEITNAPITNVLVKRLPWLDKNHPMANKFDRDPPGKQRADRDSPIGYKIWNSSFFGTRSY